MVRRSEVYVPGQSGVFHCVSRCVRRAFLCGRDQYSGEDYEHRKDWVYKRLRFLCEVFGYGVCGYAVMSNHLHVILQVDGDLHRRWSDEEVLRRWNLLHPWQRDETGRGVPMSESLINQILVNKSRIQELRKRLGNLSWFMKSLSEYIARLANREDGVTGRFWEGRFRMKELTHPGAILACMVYVDLNPVRAGEVVFPEDARFSSMGERMRSNTCQNKTKKVGSALSTGNGQNPPWLLPMREVLHIPESGHDKPCLNEEQYFELVNVTASGIYPGNHKYKTANLAPLLEQFELNSDTWMDCIQNFDRSLGMFVGQVNVLRSRAKGLGKMWVKGIRFCSDLFEETVQPIVDQALLRGKRYFYP